MGCDLVAALGAATVTGHTLVACNHFGPGADGADLSILPAKVHAPGESIAHPRVKVPEVRQTARVLGWKTPGSWGFHFGANEHQLAVGHGRWKSRFPISNDGFDGPDLVRLTLERGGSARLGADLLCELIERHGQSSAQGDNVFLVADPREAFLVEAAGSHWAVLECQRTRAVCDAGLIRQEWQRLSRGLADEVMQRAWWSSDGSKIDFHGSLADAASGPSAGLKRWSRASLALTQQEGAIDAYCLRRLMLEHFDQCQDLVPRHQIWQGTQIVGMGIDVPAVVWTAPAHLGAPLFFPLIPAAQTPGVWLEGLPPLSRLWGRDDARRQEIYDRLQAIFDQDVEVFLQEARNLQGQTSEIVRRGQEMMARHAELYLHECQPSRNEPKSRPAARPDEMFAFISE